MEVLIGAWRAEGRDATAPSKMQWTRRVSDGVGALLVLGVGLSLFVATSLFMLVVSDMHYSLDHEKISKLLSITISYT
jgi:hypothetical protein